MLAPFIPPRGNIFFKKVNSIDVTQNSQEENIVIQKHTMFSTMDVKTNQSN